MSRHGYPKSDTGTEHYLGQWFDPAGHGTPFEETFDYVSYTADKIGPNSPGYPAHKDETDYSCYESTRRFVPAHFDGSTPAGDRGVGTYSSQVLSGITDPSTLTIEDDNQATYEAHTAVVMKLQQKLKDQKVNIGNVVAEFHQTCGTVTDVATRIASAIRAVKHGNIRDAARILARGRGGGGDKGKGKPRSKPKPLPNTGSVANDWLQLQYGWKPLLSDVDGACEELARTIVGRPPVRVVKANHTAKRDSNVTLPSAIPTWPKFSGKQHVEVSCNGTIEYSVASNIVNFAANTGIINPLAVAWEVIPYSFVVDWFLPVGNFLNSLDFDTGLEFSRGWLSFHGQGLVDLKAVSGSYVADDHNLTMNWQGGGVNYTSRGYRRTVLRSFPAIVYPSFKNPISLLHANNALALLRQVFGR